MTAAIPESDLRRYLAELHDIGRLRSSSCCAFFHCLVCARDAPEVRRWTPWSEAVEEWQGRFNREVLLPRGMAVRTQRHCFATRGNGGEDRYIERWVAFALNEREAEQLLGEPHLTGNVHHGGWGRMNERHLMLHP